MCMSTPYWNLLALIKMAYIQQLNNFLYLNCNFSCDSLLVKISIFVRKKILKLYENRTK